MCFGSTEFWSLGEEPAIRGRNVYIINSVVKYIPTPAFMWNSFLIITLLFDQLVNASCMLTNIRFNPLHLIQNYRRPSRDERKINITHTNNWRGKKKSRRREHGLHGRGVRGRKGKRVKQAADAVCDLISKWESGMMSFSSYKMEGGGGVQTPLLIHVLCYWEASRLTLTITSLWCIKLKLRTIWSAF